MNKRFIHLADFPEDKIVVFLDEDYRKKFIEEAILACNGRRKLCGFLKIRKIETINRWKKGKIRRSKNWITPQGIPLDKLKKMSSIINSDYFKMLEIEKNIFAYKSKGKSLWVKNPKLPIEESPELFRIIAHMMGDGLANINNVNYFKNNDNGVLKEFASDMRHVFGDIQINHTKNIIIFPITVRHIFSTKYNISFGTFVSSVPKILFNLPKKFSAGFIRAFADDEGNVDTSTIRIYSFNGNLLNGIRNLFLQKFPEIIIGSIKRRSKISVKGKIGIEYVIEIKSSGLEPYLKKISFSHYKKLHLLKFHLKRKNKKWNHRNKNSTKMLILDALLSGPKTTHELCEHTLVSRSSILPHILGYSQKRKKGSVGLLKERLVNLKGYGKYNTYIWEITNQGKNLISSTISK